MENERDRIAESQKGDHDAFEQLIREHQRMIHSLCYRMTGSVAEAEDLAQETFIRAYQQLDSFRAEARFSSWLYRIAVNQCLKWQKRTARREQFNEDWSEQAQMAPTPEVGFAQQIQEALLKLRPKERAAIVLTTYDDLSHAEAAQV